MTLFLSFSFCERERPMNGTLNSQNLLLLACISGQRASKCEFEVLIIYSYGTIRLKTRPRISMS